MRLIGVLATAFLIKAVVLAQLGDHPLLQPHGELDTAYYVDLAQQVAGHGPLAIREPFFVSPLYVFFLAAIFACGGSLFTARLVQILLGTAAVALLYDMTRQWFGERCAWLAAALAMLTGLFTFYEILILQAALDPFLTAVVLFTITRAQLDSAPRWIVAAGIASGLLALNRPNALAYAIVAAAGIGWTAWRAASSRNAKVRAAVWRSSLFLAGLILTVAPNAIRNYAVSGQVVLISSHGGLNFYIGNNSQADGTYQRVPGITPSIVGQTRDATRIAEAATGRVLSASEVSQYFYQRAWRWIVEQPLAAAKLSGRKLLLLLNRTNVPLNYSYAYYTREESTLLRALIVGPWMLIPLGVAGLIISLSSGGEAKASHYVRTGFWVWASFVPVYAISVAAFFVADRYRMPLLIPLCATAAVAISDFADAVRQRQFRSTAVPAFAAIAAAILVNWNIHADDGRGTEQTRKAVWLVEEGRIDEANHYVDSITAHHPHPGVLRYRMGDALAAAGHLDEATRRYREALAIDRNQPAIQLALGQALVAQNHPAEAVPLLRSAFHAGYQTDLASIWLMRALILSGSKEEALQILAALPTDLAVAHEATAGDIGSIALELDAPAHAERWLRIAVAQKGGSPDLREKLGVALLMQKRAGEAIEPLDTACRLDPSSVSARLNLAVAYAQLGRRAEARTHAEDAARLDPHDARVRDLLKRLDQPRQ